MDNFEKIIGFVKELYKQEEVVALHRPIFSDRDKSLLAECVDSTFVSTVGPFTFAVEKRIEEIMRGGHAVVTVNGTCALTLAMWVLDVRPNDLVITTALSFVGTANAIMHLGAKPIFLDIEKETLGLDPYELKRFLEDETIRDSEGQLKHKDSGARIKACIPVHILGNPCRIKEIVEICKEYNLKVIEDAAESFGSFDNDIHTGLIGDLGVLSFNGNKIVTAGGGGAIVSKDKGLIDRARYLSQTAKQAHSYNFYHTEVGFNYRMPNLNAALLIGQLEKFEEISARKNEVYEKYLTYFSSLKIEMVKARKDSKSNNWLAAINLNNSKQVEEFLEFSNTQKVHCRPFWHILADLPPYKNMIRGTLERAREVQSHFVCLPLSVPLEK